MVSDASSVWYESVSGYDSVPDFELLFRIERSESSSDGKTDIA